VWFYITFGVQGQLECFGYFLSVSQADAAGTTLLRQPP